MEKDELKSIGEPFRIKPEEFKILPNPLLIGEIIFLNQQHMKNQINQDKTERSDDIREKNNL